MYRISNQLRLYLRRFVSGMYKLATMRNLYRILLTFAALFTLSNCGQRNLTPEETVEKYLTLIGEKKYDEAKELCTESRATFVDMYRDIYPNGYQITFDSTNCKLEGKEATCDCYMTGLPDTPGQSWSPFFLVYENEKWKIGNIWGHGPDTFDPDMVE